MACLTIETCSGSYSPFLSSGHLNFRLNLGRTVIAWEHWEGSHVEGHSILSIRYYGIQN